MQVRDWKVKPPPDLYQTRTIAMNCYWKKKTYEAFVYRGSINQGGADRRRWRECSSEMKARVEIWPVEINGFELVRRNHGCEANRAQLQGVESAIDLMRESERLRMRMRKEEAREEEE